MKFIPIFGELSLPDFDELDLEAADVFMDIVAAAHMLEKRDECADPEQCNVAELERRIDEGFQKMTEVYSMASGYRFNYPRYCQTMGEIYNDRKSGEEDLFPIFASYSRFLTIIEVSKELPDILKRFREQGWSEWTVLQPKRSLFLELAVRFIQAAEKEFWTTGKIDPDLAEAVCNTSMVFKVPLPKELGASVYFVLCSSPADYDSRRWTDDEAGTPLQ